MKTSPITSPMKTEELTTVLIVEDHEITSVSLARLLEKEAPIKVLNRATNMASARKMFNEYPEVDIILMDLNLKEQTKYSEPEGLILSREIIQNKDYLAHVIAITQYLEGRWIKRAYDMGVRGYLNKSCSLGELLEAIELVKQGKMYYRGIVRDEMDNYWGNTVFPPEPVKLTRREQEILEYIAEGFTSQKIASITSTMPNTIETHRASLLRKFDAENVAHLINLAFKLGFLR